MRSKKKKERTALQFWRILAAGRLAWPPVGDPPPKPQPLTPSGEDRPSDLDGGGLGGLCRPAADSTRDEMHDASPRRDQLSWPTDWGLLLREGPDEAPYARRGEARSAGHQR